MEKWKKKLQDILQQDSASEPEKDKASEARLRIDQFLHYTALPAFHKLKEEFERYGKKVTINDTEDKDEITLRVYHQDKEEFSYTIRCRAYYKRAMGFPAFGHEEEDQKFLAQILISGQKQSECKLSTMTEEDIINDFLQAYEKWRKIS